MDKNLIFVYECVGEARNLCGVYRTTLDLSGFVDAYQETELKEDTKLFKDSEEEVVYLVIARSRLSCCCGEEGSSLDGETLITLEFNIKEPAGSYIVYDWESKAAKA